MLFRSICQICGKQRTAPGDGFVCVFCRRNVFTNRPTWSDLCGQSLDGEVSGTDRCQNCQGVYWDFDSARSLFAAPLPPDERRVWRGEAVGGRARGDVSLGDVL